ncbi:MAG: NADPH-dependent oxidoreductase [Wenzhouxiangella sp.]|nr:MAG: NADPH-dependent oxidoreductase [Wenzhouxiangella sp.]
MAQQILVFLGTVRDSTPPAPARLGLRVARALLQQLEATGHEPNLVDALAIELPVPFKPHFSHRQGQAPEALDTLAEQIKAADGFVMISPEYNHAMSPALANLLNHFGSSLFSYKPSAIATYSAGQWGGTRAAVNMRTFLSELGCLPVSAMIHVPKAQEVLDSQGQFLDGVDAEAWSSYFNRTLLQLAWWAEAAQRQRQEGKTGRAGALNRDPAQRNAP